MTSFNSVRNIGNLSATPDTYYLRAAKPLQFPMDFKMQITRYSKLLFVYWERHGRFPCASSTTDASSSLQPDAEFRVTLLARGVHRSREGIQMLLCISAGNSGNMVVISKRVCIARASGYVSGMKSLRRSAPVDGRANSDSTVQSPR